MKNHSWAKKMEFRGFSFKTHRERWGQGEGEGEEKGGGGRGKGGEGRGQGGKELFLFTEYPYHTKIVLGMVSSTTLTESSFGEFKEYSTCSVH